ncbi:hypothetical protein GE09DRAFT_1081162 [Coniochaeta sp. 2T2.1]|nr:hypothetical protein GE09DRAFT_1081162 [Coniochaeta sp. 2T2.1]
MEFLTWCVLLRLASGAGFTFIELLLWKRYLPRDGQFTADPFTLKVFTDGCNQCTTHESVPLSQIEHTFQNPMSLVHSDARRRS